MVLIRLDLLIEPYVEFINSVTYVVQLSFIEQFMYMHEYTYMVGIFTHLECFYITLN